MEKKLSRSGWLFILAATVLLAVFLIYPVLYSLYLSLTSAKEGVTSFVGLGDLTGARLLAEIGDDRTRFADARALKAFAGLLQGSGVITLFAVLFHRHQTRVVARRPLGPSGPTAGARIQRAAPARLVYLDEA